MAGDLGSCSSFRWFEREPEDYDESGFGHIEDHTMIQIGHLVYLIGKLNEHNDQADTRIPVLDIEELRWTSVPIPVNRIRHTAFSKNDKIYVLGGTSTYEAGAQLCLDVITHTCTENPVYGVDPFPRLGAIGEYVESLDTFVLFGGNGANGEASNSMFCLKVEAMEWVEPVTKGTKPSPRSEHCSCVAGKSIYVFGGQDTANNRQFGELFVCEANNFVWTWSMACVANRSKYNSAMAYAFGRVFIFGGRGRPFAYSRDLYVYDTVAGDMSTVSTSRDRDASKLRLFGALAQLLRGHDMIRIGSRLVVAGGYRLGNSIMELAADASAHSRNTIMIQDPIEVFPARSPYQVQPAVPMSSDARKQEEMFTALSSAMWQSEPGPGRKFLVAKNWIDALQRFLSSPKAIRAHPGPVSNNTLFADHLFYEKRFVHSDRLVLLSKKKWDLLMKWFGGEFVLNLFRTGMNL